MQLFAPVVYLRSPAGHILRTLHAQEAARVALQCSVSRERSGRVRELTLRHGPASEQAWPHAGRAPQPVTPPRLTAYMGQRYTYRTALANAAGDMDARCYEFRFIHPDDAPLFRLSVTDCLRGA